jgi:large subunit ribosomal protein L5
MEMTEILVDKVTVNIGVGQPGERLDYAKELLGKLTGKKPVETRAKRREPVFKLRKGLPIGVKVTLRRKEAEEFLEKALAARKRQISTRNFDRTGNFSFGVPEYIDFPGAKYDPKIGMFGFDVCVTLSRRGRRVGIRKIKRSKVGKKQRISKDEAIAFATEKLKAEVS